MYELHKTLEFEERMNEQPVKARFQIEERLMHIVYDRHFGTHKRLTDHVWELKWSNGRRVYYAHIAEYNILLLLGGIPRAGWFCEFWLCETKPN